MSVTSGMYRESRVYLYLTLDAKGSITIIAHEQSDAQRSWTFVDLREVDLFKPFNFFMQFEDINLRTRGHKIRYLVYYFFMVAENSGMIDELKV